MIKYHNLSSELLEEIEKEPRDKQAQWLFLSPSSEFKGRWSVEAIYPDFFFDFEETIGHYRTVSPARLEEFMDLARDLGYQVVFEEPPLAILGAYEHLKDPPPFELNSTLSDTVNGFLPWQIQGFNKLVRDEDLNSGLVIWDTGTGKTAFISSALLWHKEEGHPFELALIVVKKNNKVDTQYKLQKLAGIDSYIIDASTPAKRYDLYEQIEMDLIDGKRVVAITNYDKFREDQEFLEFIMEKREMLIFWDEMPTKLSNRSAKLYNRVKRCIWRTFSPTTGGKLRPSWVRQWALTATPIENSPAGLFSYLRLMNPTLLGAVEEFDTEYVSFRNPASKKPERFRNLDKLEAKIEFMTHRVSREDPEVAKMFPEVMEDLMIIDWDPRDRKVYDLLTDKAEKILSEDDEYEPNILALIQVMQMLCDAPTMITQSAENRQEFDKLIAELGEEDELPRLDGPKGSEIALMLLKALRSPPTNDHHTKFEALREILTEKHPNDKALVYMTWASYGFGPLTAKLDEWGVTYVTYTGTDKQRQEAKDRFRTDPSIQVFLSSDKGSDSIDLPEAAVGINYNLPWTWTRKRQRQGRNDRVDSKLETTWWYDLIMANSIEQRKREIIDTKHGYHKALFDGKAIEDSMSSKLTKEDLMYILLG